MQTIKNKINQFNRLVIIKQSVLYGCVLALSFVFIGCSTSINVKTIKDDAIGKYIQPSVNQPHAQLEIDASALSNYYYYCHGNIQSNTQNLYLVIDKYFAGTYTGAAIEQEYCQDDYSSSEYKMSSLRLSPGLREITLQFVEYQTNSYEGITSNKVKGTSALTKNLYLEQGKTYRLKTSDQSGGFYYEVQEIR